MSEMMNTTMSVGELKAMLSSVPDDYRVKIELGQDSIKNYPDEILDNQIDIFPDKSIDQEKKVLILIVEAYSCL